MTHVDRASMLLVDIGNNFAREALKQMSLLEELKIVATFVVALMSLVCTSPKNECYS